jgi:putative lipase involved disintegration of autophagic bodies
MVTAADVTFLSGKLQIALSDVFLKDITNHDGSGTSIDTDRLEYVSQAALGEFEDISRITFDSTNYGHMKICVDLARLIFKQNMNHYSDKDAQEYESIKSRLNKKHLDQTAYSKFSSFGSQTTGKFDDDDWSDFR